MMLLQRESIHPLTNLPLLLKETHRKRYLLITVETAQDQGVRTDPQSIITVKGIKKIKDLRPLRGPERNLKAPNMEEKREKVENIVIIPDPIQNPEAKLEKDTVVRDQGHIPVLEASIDISQTLVRSPETGRGIDIGQDLVQNPRSIDIDQDLVQNPETGRGIDVIQDLQIDCNQATKLRMRLKPK